MNSRKLLLFAVACFTVVIACDTARAEHRVALVISNSQYDNAELPLPQDHAETVATWLKQHGFRVDVQREVKTAQELKTKLESFARSVPVRGTAVVYFAGYAMQGEYKGTSDGFLLPLEANPKDHREIGSKGYGIARLSRLFSEESGAEASLILVDGCYEHLLRGEQVRPGLPQLESLPAQSLVAYATKPGEVLAHDKASDAAFANALTRSKRPFLESIGQAAAWQHSTLNKPAVESEPALAVLAGPADLRPGKRAGEEWINGRGMVFCWCPPGSFRMGTPAGELPRQDDETPAEVTIAAGFWMAKYELTVQQCSKKLSPSAVATDKNHPQDMIHWDDIRTELRQLNESERKAGRLPNDWEYALPSEQQWEYAARAGTSTPWYFGSSVNELPQHANFADKALFESTDGYFSYAHRTLNDGAEKLAVVGSYRANPWGLHDVYGNVWEWCRSKYVKLLPSGTTPLPTPKDAGSPVIRGGAWVSRADYCRSAVRQGWGARAEQNFIGYRYVLQRKQD